MRLCRLPPALPQSLSVSHLPHFVYPSPSISLILTSGKTSFHTRPHPRHSKVPPHFNSRTDLPSNLTSKRFAAFTCEFVANQKWRVFPQHSLGLTYRRRAPLRENVSDSSSSANSSTENAEIEWYQLRTVECTKEVPHAEGSIRDDSGLRSLEHSV